jgi:CRP/FNR family transcriptional regulator, cyclic AMP receptor protein
MSDVDWQQKNKEILIDEIIAIFRKTPKFSLIPEIAINDLIHAGEVLSYQPGDYVLREDEFDERIYILIRGALDITKSGRFVRRTERTGDMFGEMGAIDASPRSASIVAVTASSLLSVDLAYLDQKLKNGELGMCYLIYRLFSEVLAERVRETTEENVRLLKAIAKLGHVE